MLVHQTPSNIFLRTSMSLTRSTGSRIVLSPTAYTLEPKISYLNCLRTDNIELLTFWMPHWMFFRLKSQKGLEMKVVRYSFFWTIPSIFNWRFTKLPLILWM